MSTVATPSAKTLKFIEKAKVKHGDKYDYSKVDYKAAKTKVCIICKVHGEFEQTPDNHATGYGCSKCANNVKSNVSDFITRAKAVHNDKYDYSKAVYKNADTPLTIICAEHGEFMQRPDFHINRKTGCPKCNGGIRANVDDFIRDSKKIHGNKYDYSNIDYKNNRTPVVIICPVHGKFLQTPYLHSLPHFKCGCPHCINKTEYKLLQTLLALYPTILHQYKVEWCKNRNKLPYDFCIPELKIIIELDGEQHFKQVAKWRSPELQIISDAFKTKCANDNGFHVIRVVHALVRNEKNTEWFTQLQSYITTILALPPGTPPQNYFICKGSGYSYDRLIELQQSKQPMPIIEDDGDDELEIDADDLDFIDENDTGTTGTTGTLSSQSQQIAS